MTVQQITLPFAAHRPSIGRPLWVRSALLFAWIVCIALPVDFAERAHAAPHPLLVAYFPQWGLYNATPYLVRDLARSGGAALLDQLNYAQGAVAGGRCAPADPNADLNYTFSASNSVDGRSDRPTSRFRGHFHQLAELKRKYPHLKILISLEGSAAFFAADAQPEARQAFVASCIDVFLQGHFAPGVSEPGIFDGIDVDWEFPQAEDAGNYVALLQEFRRQMDAGQRGWRLNVALAPGLGRYRGVDMEAVGRAVDQVGVMNYDYHGPWERTTGLIAPLFPDAADPRGSGSVAGTLKDYEAAGIAPAKLLMGLPFYGYGWENVPAAAHGLYQPATPIPDDHPYGSIASLIPHSTIFRNPETQAPWLYDGNRFWTYEDPLSIETKIGYVRREGLGGVMIWELSGDTPDGTLLKAAHRALVETIDSR